MELITHTQNVEMYLRNICSEYVKIFFPMARAYALMCQNKFPSFTHILKSILSAQFSTMYGSVPVQSRMKSVFYKTDEFPPFQFCLVYQAHEFLAHLEKQHRIIFLLSSFGPFNHLAVTFSLEKSLKKGNPSRTELCECSPRAK